MINYFIIKTKQIVSNIDDKGVDSTFIQMMSRLSYTKLHFNRDLFSLVDKYQVKQSTTVEKKI